jgi:hypothetical protein
MSVAELKEFSRRAAHLSPVTVEEQFRQLWERCRPDRGALPTPRTMQEIVALWKLLWRQRR